MNNYFRSVQNKTSGSDHQFHQYNNSSTTAHSRVPSKKFCFLSPGDVIYPFMENPIPSSAPGAPVEEEPTAEVEPEGLRDLKALIADGRFRTVWEALEREAPVARPGWWKELRGKMKVDPVAKFVFLACLVLLALVAGVTLFH